MEITYFCKNEQCQNPDIEPFMKKLNFEAVMDDKNIAVMFCPYCKQSLVRGKNVVDTY